MLKNALLAAALALSAYAVGSADARTRHGEPMGWYVAVEGGANFIEDADGSLDVGPINTPFEAQFDTGWAVIGEIGYRFEDNWRLEVEIGYRDNDVDCLNFGGGVCAPFHADVSQTTQMINLIYDLPLNDDMSLSLGAGIGGDFVKADTPYFKDSDYVAAAQLIAGLNFELSDSVQLFVDYRLLLTDDPDWKIAPAVRAGMENVTHTVSIGLRFDLDPDDAPAYVPSSAAVPRPIVGPPPPAPAGDPKHYVVFFGFNKANLTLKAQAVVAEAAETAKSGGAASILVTGHTDTVGPAGYNQVLSEKRAGVVKRELVRLGIPAGSIKAIGKGETMLLVQTPDRTWEDRNRRATIDLN